MPLNISPSQRARVPFTYGTSVFINYPFDAEYEPILRAMIFALEDLGFAARSAAERSNSAENRLTKVIKLIDESLYSIHDLSRTKKLNDAYPRYNMPFELGLTLGSLTWGEERHRAKSFLILDSEPHRYLEYISDIRGFDIKYHSNDPLKVIACIREWLGGDRDRFSGMVGGEAICARYSMFCSELPGILRTLSVQNHELTFVDFTHIVSVYISVIGPPPIPPETFLAIRSNRGNAGKNKRESEGKGFLPS